jgi:hypothetical protein
MIESVLITNIINALGEGVTSRNWATIMKANPLTRGQVTSGTQVHRSNRRDNSTRFIGMPEFRFVCNQVHPQSVLWHGSASSSPVNQAFLSFCLRKAPDFVALAK